MDSIIDYTGKEWHFSNNCQSCAFKNNEFSIPCGVAYEDDVCTVNQDWENPINGFMVLMVKRHVEFFEDLTVDERNHIFDVVNKVISVMRKNDVAHYYNVIFEEKPGVHFHVWLLPRDGWKEMGGGH